MCKCDDLFTFLAFLRIINGLRVAIPNSQTKYTSKCLFQQRPSNANAWDILALYAGPWFSSINAV